MEVNVRREDLARGLHQLQGVVERRTTQPVLSHVLIQCHDGGITLTATDTEVSIRGQVKAQVKKSGSITVSARKLYEITREVASEDVTLRIASPGWVEVLAGRSKFKIVSLDPQEFPEIPFSSSGSGASHITIAAGLLREAIDKTLFAVSTDDARFNLSGVYVERADTGALRMVATDGHRLALIERTLASFDLKKGVIMPRKGLAEVRKLLDMAEDTDLTLSVGERDVQVHMPEVSFFMRLVEGEFPDYRQVVPGPPRVKVNVNRDDLQAAIRRISLLASDRSHGIKMQLGKGVLELSASNPEQGEATEDVEVSYSGEALTVGFNAKFLLEALNVHAAGDVLELGLNDDVGPGLLRGALDPDYTYVVMPMRL